MSDATHADDGEHGDGHAGEQGEHGHGEHGHGEHAAPLAPINWAAWGAGTLGIGAGLLVALCLYIATSL
ncbi:MAG TPA: hypothetical protein VLM76_05745 [Patescibacteria group bacterium]|nr:hypothetical protein [Patescibacteria group bacterium]